MTRFDTSVFIAKFVEEARDRLKSLGEALLRLEHAPGAPPAAINAAIDQAMREAHSLKGSALMLSPPRGSVRGGQEKQVAHRR